VVGDAALRVGPAPDALAAGLARLLADERLRAELRAAGQRRAALFSWKATAQRTLDVYERVAG
jgi:alpha-1,3-rhamnosyl/mannosyltransferase